MNKPEVLSPVGSMACLYAAIEGGGDAVYLAGKLFGARAFADNFSNEELIFAINYSNYVIYPDFWSLFIHWLDSYNLVGCNIHLYYEQIFFSWPIPKSLP